MSVRTSFIARLFALLFALALAILILAGVSIFLFARTEVGNEFIRLNQATLQQQAAAIGSSLTELRAYGGRIAINSRLNELIASPTSEGLPGAKSLLNDINNEYISSRSNANMLMETHVVSMNGMSLSVYNTPGYTLERLQQDPRYEPLLSGQVDMLMLPTAYNPQGRGVQVYSYQMAFAMKPVLAAGQDKPRGLVIFDISEITLFSRYRGFEKNDVRMNIIDEKGQILSGQEKGQIGSLYRYTPEQLEEVSRLRSIRKRTLEDSFYLHARIPGTEWLLVERIPAKIALGTLETLLRAILLIIAVFGLCMLLAFLQATRRALTPVLLIKDKMEQVMTGDLSVRIPLGREDEFGRIERAFNGMVEQISLLIEEVKTQEKQKRMAELDFLQAQINPHFIYNTLTSIRFMLEMGKAEEAGEMVFFFSKLLRETLSRSDEFVTLGEELDTLKSYVSLQKLRYRDTFALTYQVAPETLSSTIPALLLQPVVENAIFHASKQGKITIQIAAFLREGQLVLTVADNGIGMSSSHRQAVLHKALPINRVGLRNVQERIQLTYGSEYGLALSETPGGGTTVTFTLPFAPKPPR